jgi:hypothetical protein
MPCLNLSALPRLPPPPLLPCCLTPPAKYRCRPLPHPAETEISFVMENNKFKMKVTLAIAMVPDKLLYSQANHCHLNYPPSFSLFLPLNTFFHLIDDTDI